MTGVGPDTPPPIKSGSEGQRRARAARTGTGVRAALSHHPAAWGRRDGRRLSGVGYRARRRGGDQGDSSRGDVRRDDRRRHRAALQAGAAARAPGHAQERRPHSRHRADRRHQVHHDVVRRRHRSHDGGPRRGTTGDTEGAADCPLGRVRAGRCARRRRRPSGSQAGQHHAAGGRHRADHGFRHRAVNGRSGSAGATRRRGRRCPAARRRATSTRPWPA